MAIGDRHAPSVDSTYTAPGYLSQHPWDHVRVRRSAPAAAWSSNVFPADAEYVRDLDGLGSNARFEDIDISINGERLALLVRPGPAGGADGRGGPSCAPSRSWSAPDNIASPRRSCASSMARTRT
jgi:hypothetical protein